MNNMLEKFKMFTMEEVAELFHVSVNQIAMLREVGIMPAIKTGKNYMFTQSIILEFQTDYIGYDVSNRVNAVRAFKEVCKMKEEVQYGH